MKKMTKLFSMLTLALCVVSCQLSGVDDSVVAGKTLTVTAVIDAGTRVSYAVDNEIAYTITPTWTVGDKIIGFDDKGVKFTFTVEEQEDGVAALNVGSYLPGSATKLYAIYAPGLTEDNIVGGELAVDLSAQNGALNDASKVLMHATAAIEAGTVRFHFEKSTAVVGLRKFKLPVTFATPISRMKLNGVVTSGTFRVVDGAMTLVPCTTRGTITATRTWTTDNTGLCTVPAYFSVVPTKDAQMTVDADTPSKTYSNLHPIDKMDVEAGIYYHMTKLFYAPEAAVNNVPYSTVVEAFDAANEIDEPVVITLLSNCKLEEPVVLCNAASQGYTLDLNGKTLTTTAANNIILSLCEMTITDLSTDNPASYGTITTEAGNSNAYIITVQDEAVLKMAKGNIVAPTYRCLSFKDGGGGELYGDGLISAPNSYCIYLTATGGFLNIREDIRIAGKGNTVYYGAGDSEITGGIISNTASGAIVYVSGADATLRVSNCRVSSTYTSNRNPFYSNAGAKVYVTGGCYGMPIYDVVCKDENDTPYVNVLNTDPATSSAYPYMVVEGSPEISTVSAEYHWNHGTVESAVKHADYRSTQHAEAGIALIKDLSLSETLSLPSSHAYGFTFELNGHTLTSSASPAVSTGGNLSLEDAVGTGEIVSTSGIGMVATAGDITISGGSLVGTTAALSVSGSANATINKGWFAADAADLAKGGSAKLAVYGGNYKNDPTPFLAEGCEANTVSETHNGRTYTYQVKGGAAAATVNNEECPSFENALSLALAYKGSDDTVTLRLLKDVTDYDKRLDLTNKSGKPFILDLNGHTLGVAIDSCMTTSGTLIITDRSGTNTGKFTSSKRKQLHFRKGQVIIKDCIVECTRGGYMATGGIYVMLNAAGTSDAYNTGGLSIINCKVYSNSYLKPIYVAYGNLTIENSELTCGSPVTPDSGGGYYIVDVYTGGNVVINDSSFLTYDRRSNGDKYGCVHTRTGNISSGSNIELNNCWFYSGKGLSTAADHAEYSKVFKIKNCYSNVDFTEFLPQATYVDGTSLQPIDPPAKHTHMGTEYSYGYQVK